MIKEVVLVTGAGQLSMAIARRVGFGKKIILGDKKKDHAEAIAKIMNDAGFDVVPMEMDLSSRGSILTLIAEGQKYGEIKMLVNGAGVSPSQAPIEAILKVDLYGTAVLFEEVGKVITEGGTGVTISSQSGWRMPALTAEQDEQLATTPTEECCHSPCSNLKIFAIRSMPIKWPNVATKSASWRNPSNGAIAARGSMTLLPESL